MAAKVVWCDLGVDQSSRMEIKSIIIPAPLNLIYRRAVVHEGHEGLMTVIKEYNPSSNIFSDSTQTLYDV